MAAINASIDPSCDTLWSESRRWRGASAAVVIVFMFFMLACLLNLLQADFAPAAFA